MRIEGHECFRDLSLARADVLVDQRSGDRKMQILEIEVSPFQTCYQARRYGGGVFAGHPEDLMARQQKQFADQVASFPEEPGVEDLARLFESSLS